MNRITEMRKEMKLGQQELAEKINMSRGAISSYETGRRDLSTDVIASLCELFNCSADYLLGLSDDRGGKDAPTGKADERIMLDVTALSLENRLRLEDYIRLLLKSQEK